MPVGDAQRAFMQAAAADGIRLRPGVAVPWINGLGHFALPREAQAAYEPLDRIFLKLDGKVGEQKAKQRRALSLDFVHELTGTIVELDEMQHFTSYRRSSLELYPAGLPTGFDVGRYVEICDRWSAKADKYRASKPAVGFGAGGRQKQRAYFDALRDIAAPAMGRPAVIRVDCLDNDGAEAFFRNRERIHCLLEL